MHGAICSATRVLAQWANGAIAPNSIPGVRRPVVRSSFTVGGFPPIGAAATASITNSGITSIRITDAGTNYVSAPIITIQHPSAVAIGTTGATVGVKAGQVQATAIAKLSGDSID